MEGGKGEKNRREEKSRGGEVIKGRKIEGNTEKGRKDGGR